MDNQNITFEENVELLEEENIKTPERWIIPLPVMIIGMLALTAVVIIPVLIHIFN